jgi:hypothetical protein
MAKTMKKRDDGKRYVWRDASTGRLLDVVVADPPVRPKGVSVGKIREAVRKSGGGSATVRKYK